MKHSHKGAYTYTYEQPSVFSSSAEQKYLCLPMSSPSWGSAKR